ncbi:LamG-like jellyroll fold domain-containing protein, partial [Aurantibacter sp.]|uniref:LamG-like jellyroll fold domain-containing protein n=1 Tax=Aurantibacter sp. TaxID=2807103 RepID=UPI0032644E3F
EEEEEEVENELDELIGHWPLDEQNGINANDISNKGLVGTLKNGLTFDTHKTDGHIGSAVYFDGSDKRISLPDIDNNVQSGLSVSAWINPSNAEGGYQGIVGSSTSGGFMMFIKQNKLAFKVTTNENGKKLVSAGNIQNNNWQMITCTYDGSTMEYYINGENVHSESLPGTLRDKDEAWLGWSGWGEEYFEGDMDDVRLFNKALTAEQIFSMYEDGTIDSVSDNVNTEQEPITIATAEAYAYPNPTVGRFKISGLSPGIKSITVFDFASDVLISLESDETEPELDLSAYPDGIYIIRVLQNGLEHAFKVIKE